MSGQQPLPFPEGGGGVMAARDDVIAAALSLAAATWALNARVEAGDPWAAADLAFAHERLDEALAAYVRDETAGRPAEAAGRAERVNPPPFVAGFNPAAPVPPQQPSAWREEVGDVFDGLRYLSVVAEGLGLHVTSVSLVGADLLQVFSFPRWNAEQVTELLTAAGAAMPAAVRQVRSGSDPFDIRSVQFGGITVEVFCAPGAPELSTDPSDLERLPEVEDGGGVVERAAPQSGGAS